MLFVASFSSGASCELQLSKNTYGNSTVIYFTQDRDGVRDDGVVDENYSTSLATLKEFFIYFVSKNLYSLEPKEVFFTPDCRITMKYIFLFFCLFFFTLYTRS